MQSQEILLGNVCRVEYIEEAEEVGIVKVMGDIVFKQYFSVEENSDTLFIHIKNPNGSEVHWNEYDRFGSE